jgi:TonB family protein
MSQSARPIADVAVLREGPAPDNTAVLAAVDSAASVGMKLAAARKAKGLTQTQVHLGTKIKLNHIVAIEAGDAGSLPATPFVAGFVKAYAQFLGLDADAFSRAYKAEAAGAAAAGAERPQPEPQSPAAPAAEIMSPSIVVQAAAVEISQAPVIATPVAAAPVMAAHIANPAPTQRAAFPGVAPEKLTAVAGVSAIALIAFWIGGQVASKNHSRPAAIVEARVAEPVAPVAAPAPIAPEIAAPTPELAPPPQTVRVAAADPALDEAAKTIAISPPRKKPAVAKPAELEPVETTPAPVMIEMAHTPAEPTPAPVVEAPAPVVRAATLLKPAAPDYPERCAARAAKEEAVGVMFNVSVDGRAVGALAIESTNACFNAAAVEAAYKMRFSPRTVDGVPQVEPGKTATIRFVR